MNHDNGSRPEPRRADPRRHGDRRRSRRAQHRLLGRHARGQRAHRRFLPDLGGQLTTLYPEKWIYDVPGYPRVLARDLVELLKEQTLGQFDVPVWLETTADRVEYEPNPDDSERRILRLVTDRGDLLSRTIVIAGGHGAFEPKKLPGYDMTPWRGAAPTTWWARSPSSPASG